MRRAGEDSVGRTAPAVESLCVIIRHRHPNILAAVSPEPFTSHIYDQEKGHFFRSWRQPEDLYISFRSCGLLELTLTIEINLLLNLCSNSTNSLRFWKKSVKAWLNTYELTTLTPFEKCQQKKDRDYPLLFGHHVCQQTCFKGFLRQLQRQLRAIF